MTEEARVRDIWKSLTVRAVVGERLTCRVGARAWERPFFARFARFFARCGVPDPWDPSVGPVEIGLGEVGIAQRKSVAPHAAPPSAGGAGKAASLPNVPRAAPAPPPESRAPVDGKPAPRIGEIRRDDTEELKRKLAETERRKVDPARANLFKVNQPVARLPQRPELAAGDPVPRAGANAASPTPSSRTAGTGGTPPRPPPRPSAPGRPARMSVEPSRPALRDGPEEIVEDISPAVRTTVYGGFGMDGGWEDEPDRAVVRNDTAVAGATEGVRPATSEAVADDPIRSPATAAPTPSPAPPASSNPASSVSPSSSPRPSSSPPPSSAPPVRPAPSLRPATPPRPPKPGGGGMDDLFGMGGGDNTRFKMPKREEADATKPRRPMVTSDEDLKKAGIDRRPPSGKAPTVVAAPGGPSAEPADDGGE